MVTLRAGQARCCVRGTGEKSVSSRASALRWSDQQSVAAIASSATLPTPGAFLSPPELPPMVEPPSKKVKIEESFELSEQQQQLIREDTANKKLWDEALDSLKEGPVGTLLQHVSLWLQGADVC